MEFELIDTSIVFFFLCERCSLDNKRSSVRELIEFYCWDDMDVNVNYGCKNLHEI